MRLDGDELGQECPKLRLHKNIRLRLIRYDGWSKRVTYQTGQYLVLGGSKRFVI
ncbi:MAG: hypothetical protein AAFN77_16450 [Planctomycetota bacterium]